jgi:excisionase family DNA binding protein
MQARQYVSFTMPLEDFKQLLSLIVRNELQTHQKNDNEMDPNELLTIQEACSYLKVSRPTVYGLMKEKKLRCRYLSKNRLRFLRADLIEYVKSQGGKPQ